MTLARLVRISRQRIRSALRKDSVDGEMARELAFHLEELAREHVAAGMSPDEARVRARRELGNVPLVEERCRDQRRVTWLHDLRQDVAYGLRMLRRTPALTAIAVLSLGIGIGTNAATFRVIDRVLIEGLPFPDAGRLVVIRTYPLDNPNQIHGASLPDYVAWRERTRTFDGMGALLGTQGELGEHDGTGGPEAVRGCAFTPGLFTVLGAQPMLGRVFTDIEAQSPKPAAVIIISHRIWLRRFGGDPKIVGRRIRFNALSTEIVGVMPPAFRYPDDSIDYWVPLRVDRERVQGTARLFGVAGRLRQGATLQQAEADLMAVAAMLATEAPDRHRGWGVRVNGMHDALYGWAKGPLLTLQAAVAMLLLIGCVNVGGLLIARGAARKPELAIRMSLGAGRSRIVRQLVAESALLAMLASALGVLVAWWGVRALMGLTPIPGLPRIPAVGLDVRVLAMLVGLSIAAGLLFGVAPALASSKQDLVGAAGPPARGMTPSWNVVRLRGLLVVAQIALALMLLVCAGLLMNSFIRLSGRVLNFEPRGLLSVEFRVPGPHTRQLGSVRGYPYVEVAPPPSVTLEHVLGRLRGLAGVESAAGISYQPMNSFIVPRLPIVVDGQPIATDADRGARTTAYFLVTPGFFATMKTGIVRGREFEPRDTAAAQWVAVVNETMARQFWPNEDPIGKHVTVDDSPEPRPRVVVGVVRDIPLRRNDARAEPVVYTSYLQQPSRYAGAWPAMFGRMIFVVRTAGEPGALVPAVRRTLADADPRPSLAAVTLWDQADRLLQQRHAHVLALGAFAFAATLLAAIGIYGVLAYSVAQRTREIGIRIALGADARGVVALVGRQAAWLIATGLVLGLAGSLALTGLMTSQLWGITPTDPPTFLGVSLILLLVALTACAVPVRRALAVDPTIALKYE